MTRLEAIAVLLIAGVCMALAVWVWWSLVRGRRRVPGRIEPVSISDIGRAQDEINRIREKQRGMLVELEGLRAAGVIGSHAVVAPGFAVPVDGDPRDFPPCFFRQIALEIEDALLTPQRKEARDRMIGVLDEDPPDFAGAFDKAAEEYPPSSAGSPWAEARPWAHA